MQRRNQHPHDVPAERLEHSSKRRRDPPRAGSRDEPEAPGTLPHADRRRPPSLASSAHIPVRLTRAVSLASGRAGTRQPRPTRSAAPHVSRSPGTEQGQPGFGYRTRVNESDHPGTARAAPMCRPCKARGTSRIWDESGAVACGAQS